MINELTLYGHVGKDPETVNFPDTGNKVVKFSVAIKEYSNKTDEEKPMWINVDAWNGVGERVLKTLKKGREVVIQGRLSISTYSKDVNGTEVKMTKTVMKLTDFQACGSKPSSDDEAEAEQPKQEAPKRRKAAAKG